jgi:hypothetical protein
MAGDIRDSACRIFTRSVAAAISEGLPIATAVTAGRSAAFLHAQSNPGPVDWALPALFACQHLPSAYRLVEVERARQVRTSIVKLDLTRPPVLCVREEFFELLNRLVDPDDDLAVLALHAGRDGRPGGSRLLRELGAAAFRSGHVPCRIGPFEPGSGPTTMSKLVLMVEDQILQTRYLFETAEGWRSAAVARLAEKMSMDVDATTEELIDDVLSHLRQHGDPDGLVIRQLVRDLRTDLLDLARDVRQARPDLFAANPLPILLLDDVHTYDRALSELFDKMLKTTGVGPGAATKVPVALFGKMAPEACTVLQDCLDRLSHSGWAEVRAVQLFHEIARDRSSDDDLIAYRWLLLHPEPALGGPKEVLVPRIQSPDGTSLWEDVARAVYASSTQVYDPDRLSHLADVARKHEWFVADDDQAILVASGLHHAS